MGDGNIYVHWNVVHPTFNDLRWLHDNGWAARPEDDIFVYQAASRELSGYLENPTLSPFLWLRQITGRELAKIHGEHLGKFESDEGVSLHRGALPGANSISLAAHLLGTMSSSSADAVKVETRMHVQEALNAMDATDREILALKHFERLDMDEIARVLSLSKGDVGKRYLRAIKRLRAVVSQIPGFQGL